MSKLRMRKLKEKFDKEFVLPFQRDVVKPNMTDEIWNWITSTYTPAILEELKMVGFDKEKSDVTQEYQSTFLDGYNQAVEELNSKISTLQEDKPRKERGIGRSQEEL